MANICKNCRFWSKEWTETCRRCQKKKRCYHIKTKPMRMDNDLKTFKVVKIEKV